MRCGLYRKRVGSYPVLTLQPVLGLSFDPGTTLLTEYRSALV